MQRSNYLWVLIVAVASIACWQAAQSAPRDDEDAELYRLFVDAVEHIDRSYVKSIDRRELIESAIGGMLDHLDPYSNYITKNDLRQFNRHTTGKFGGIGIQISKRSNNEPLTVISPLVGTPAYEAGILAGDRILEVDGEQIKGMSLNEIVDRLTGPPGTEVTILVHHKPYASEPFKVTLKRAEINVESVLGDTHGKNDTWDFMIDKENKIGYIRINSFIQSTADDLREAIDGLLDDGMKGLVLDLRYNPGGLLSSAIEVCDMFIADGKIVGTTGRNTEAKEYFADKAGTLPDFPMAVLVNQYSASASEIVSACLQDHERAVIIGERTWGKGSVQNVIELEGGQSALKLTTASYQRPSGANIHRFRDSKESDEWGVKPNKGFDVDFTLDQHRRYSEWRRKRDMVLGKASELKKAAKAAAKAANGKKADQDEKPKADQKPEEKGAEKSKDESKDAADNEAPAKFEDTQMAKAMEYLREKIAGKTEKAAAKTEKAAAKTEKAAAKAEK